MAASLVRTVRFREGAEESRREEYRKCRERLHDPAKASTSDLWRRYEDAYNALCIELLRTDDEHQALKNRMSGSELVDMLKFHILAAPARKYQIGTQTDNKTALKKMNFPVEPVGGVIWQGSEKEPKYKLEAFKAWMNQELEKWRGDEEGGQIIDLALLATADAGIEGIDKEMIGLIIDYPQESWEIMNIRVELVTQLQKKWELVLRELPNHLEHNYIDFKKNWDFHLKENVPAPFDPERELAFMKQLLRAELPQLEVARSAEEVWKILDFIYDHQVVLGNSSLLRNFWSQKADEKDTLTVTVFSILSGGVPNETSKVRLSKSAMQRPSKNRNFLV